MASSLKSSEDDHLPPFTQDASIIKTLSGKNVFLTGATGFVGKVILEKLIRTVPDVNRVYVLVRPRKDQSVQQRLNDEVLNTRAFDVLREKMPNFSEWANSKVIAVGGELTQNELGLSKEDQQMLQSELHCIIHCAAVVDFNERLDRAIELNTLGSLRMLELGKKCKDLGAFVHISTCYVNSNKPTHSFIEEKLYPLGFEPEELIKKVLAMSSVELDSIVSTGILRDWPNTYTMTKAMTEHLLVKNRENIPLVIVRPSIVGCSYKEPMTGWVDTISAAGAVYVAIGTGIVRSLPGSPRNVGDVIPVDYVADTIIASIAIIYNKQSKWFICQAASSSENPMYWGIPLCFVPTFFARYPPPRSIATPKFRFSLTPQIQQLRFMLQYSAPSALVNALALVSSSMYKEKARLMDKLTLNARLLVDAFSYFTQNEWTYDNRNVRAIYTMISEEERNLFFLDLSDFCWLRYAQIFSYGLTTFTLKKPMLTAKLHEFRYIDIANDVYSPLKDTLINSIAPDINAIATVVAEREVKCKFPPVKSTPEVIDDVVSSPEVQNAMKNEITYITNHGNGKKKLKETPTALVQHRVDSIVKSMFGNYHPRTVHSTAWLLRKIWRRVYSGVYVAKDNLPEILEAAKNGPIIYLPNHRSYVDFLLMSYVAFLFQLPLPNIAAGEDFLGIFAVRQIFRNSGAFFIRRSFSNDALYTAILNKHVDNLLKNGQSIEFYLEGTRSRTGKSLRPKTGMLSVVLNAVAKGIAKNVTIVPVTFNYEKTMENSLYADELSGNRKVKESLSALIRARSVIHSTFGATTVVFGKPIAIESWVQEFDKDMQESLEKRKRMQLVLNHQKQVGLPSYSMVPSFITNNCQSISEAPLFDLKNIQHGKYMIRQLAFKVMNEIAVNNEVMPVHIIASLLLQYRHGVSRNQLKSKVQLIHNEIERRGGYVFGMEMESIDYVMDTALTLIQDVIRRPNPNIYEPAITSRNEYNNMLLLGLYKNRLLNYFFHESLWCVAIYALSRVPAITKTEKQTNTDNSLVTSPVSGASQTSSDVLVAHNNTVDILPVNINEALQQVEFLHSLIHGEFVYRADPDEPVNHLEILESMIVQGILTKTPTNQLEVSENGEGIFSYFCSLLWPFVDSYYTAAMALHTLVPSISMDKDSLVLQAQWLGNTLYHESVLCFFESCSKETLGNAFETFISFGALQFKASKKASKPLPPDGSASNGVPLLELTSQYQNEQILEKFIARISFLRRQPLISRSISRKASIAEIPMLAKVHTLKPKL